MTAVALTAKKFFSDSIAINLQHSSMALTLLLPRCWKMDHFSTGFPLFRFSEPHRSRLRRRRWQSLTAARFFITRLKVMFVCRVLAFDWGQGVVGSSDVKQFDSWRIFSWIFRLEAFSGNAINLFVQLVVYFGKCWWILMRNDSVEFFRKRWFFYSILGNFNSDPSKPNLFSFSGWIVLSFELKITQNLVKFKSSNTYSWVDGNLTISERKLLRTE